jgi:hypothetical protein
VDVGECRKKAPLDVTIKTERRVISHSRELWVYGRAFPVTALDCWCGEFEYRELEEDEDL